MGEKKARSHVREVTESWSVESERSVCLNEVWDEVLNLLQTWSCGFCRQSTAYEKLLCTAVFAERDLTERLMSCWHTHVNLCTYRVAFILDSVAKREFLCLVGNKKAGCLQGLESMSLTVVCLLIISEYSKNCTFHQTHQLNMVLGYCSTTSIRTWI